MAGSQSENNATQERATGSGSSTSQPSGARPSQASSNSEKPGMLFDAWHLFQQNEVESIPGILYQGLGTHKNC